MAVVPGPVAYAPSDQGYVAHQVTGSSGPFVVLLPTSTASFESWWELPSARSFLERLAEHCRVVLLDRRGTGPSDPLGPDEHPDATTHAADVVAVIEHLDARDVVIVGESYDGGPTALLTAAVVPDRIGRVVTLNLPLAPITPEIDLDTDELIETILWGGDHLPADLELVPSVADDEAYAAWAERAGRATGPAVARGMWEAMLGYDLTDVAPDVTVPVTVVDTGHWTAPSIGVAALVETLPDATRIAIQRADSIMFLGDTEELLDHLLVLVTGEHQPAPVTRQLLAVLVSDLVGSTERAAELGDDAWRALLDTHDTTSARIVGEHGGRLVKQTGDGVLATFPLPSRAVAAASALVARLAGLDLPTRAGVHVGEVELRDGDVGGLAVHVAARVAATATAGEVLVSDTVRATTLGSDHDVVATGLHELKGVPGQWLLWQVAQD